ncbi:karyopherin beta 1, putative [Ichthyophthirius multifiliis]|uniref:Karyopherin beta 1, putative n=1 Tax=Ichthyophthirius multifiliis TaxID=5932 RepID=G0R0A4_ICHMU|nr:karyopherin beta 1, putative [Ichthyophthirius multifiliis]EGR29112.1 karyopherin beta 1, putative [Ichthyophthirius multifiliis]|eukprot:XP_004030348.1 karyopherin beta 1, putative [Ichthyophthirius multifiliis]
MNTLVENLKLCYNSTNQNQRQVAEQQLVQARLIDPQNFFTVLVQEFINNNNDTQFRQFCCTLINVSIHTQNNQKQFLWNTLEDGLKESIKAQLLQQMVTTIPYIQKACANAISTICTLEIPQNKWTNLIPDLTCSTQQNNDPQIRKAAILTLGQICDKFKQHKLGTTLDQKSKENMLTGILIGLQEDEKDLEIKTNSIIALGDCVEFMKDIFSQKAVRDYSTSVLLQALQNKNEDIKKLALQRSSDYVKVLYEDFSEYIPAFLNATTLAINDPNEEMSCPAMEIWATIATEYHERREQNEQVNRIDQQTIPNPNHFANIFENLAQLLLKNLTRNSEEDDFESQVQEGAQKTLGALVEVIGDPIIPIFTVFISNTIAGQDWKYRQAACLAFSCLLEGISKGAINQLILKAFSEFVKTLLDKEEKVKESGAKLLQRIAEFHPECILMRVGWENELEVIVNALKDKAFVSKYICNFFSFLAENVEINKQNAILNHADVIIQKLIENAVRNDIKQQDYFLIEKSFMAILNLIHFSRNPILGKKYLDLFLPQFQTTYQMVDERKQFLQSGILSAIHVIQNIKYKYNQKQKQACELTLIDKLDLNTANMILQLTISYFQQIKNVDSDGMYLISGLAQCIGPNFNNYIDQIWPFITHALIERQQDLDLFKTCMGTVSDISRAIETKISSKIEILNILLSLLESPTFDKYNKLHIFNCVGDIFLAAKNHANPYLDKLLNLYDIGFVACQEFQLSTDQELQDYGEQLKERLIESYIFVLHGLNDENQNKKILNNTQKIVHFIKQTSDKNLHPTVDYIKYCLTLLVDIANFYKKDVSGLINTDLTRNLILILKKFEQQQDVLDLISYAEQILREI